MKKEEENYVLTIFPWSQHSEDMTTIKSDLSRIPKGFLPEIHRIRPVQYLHYLADCIFLL